MKKSTFLVIFLSFIFSKTYADDYKFNPDMLGFSDDQSIDLSKFENKNYIYPGEYNMSLLVNNRFYQQNSNFKVIDENGESQACLNEGILEKIPFTAEIEKKIQFNQNGCFDLNSLPGFSYKVNLAQQQLSLNIPQYYLQYSNEHWDPPKLWSEGINGFILDYNLNINQNNVVSNSSSFNAYAFGVTGFNIDAWRFRADWQSSYSYNKNKIWNETQEDHKFQWNNIYAYRALKNLQADLVVGESYLNSDLFNSFNYTGVSITSNDEMLPPNLRYYAPEITGVARTNALVTVSQLGRVLYQTQVPQGSFTLRDLPNYSTGMLDVKVEEQDGTVQNFQVDAIASPYLTRPGHLRYKATVGQPRKEQHRLINNETFFSGEVAYGLNNKTSLFSGLLASKNYQNLNLGAGQDLDQFGAFSFSVLASHAKEHNGTGTGMRLGYNKYFENTRITASTSYYNNKYQDFSSYLNQSTRYSRNSSISVNQAFPNQAFNVSMTYSESKQDDNEKNQRFDLNLNKYVSFENYRNINLSLNVYKNMSLDKDYGAYFRVSFPLQTNGSLNYSASHGKNRDYASNWTYANRLDQATNYSVGVGQDGSTFTANSFLTHQASSAVVNLSASYRDKEFFNVGAGLRGGYTLTAKGMDLHRINNLGQSRILIDTDDIAGVPMRGYGVPTISNRFGVAVTPDVRNYYRNNISIDLNKLPENVDSLDTVQGITVTQGAIGYQRFALTSGAKDMVTIVLPNNKFPQFGAEVRNEKGVITGIVGESGRTYLTGMAADRKMMIENAQCQFTIPEDFSTQNKFTCQ